MEESRSGLKRRYTLIAQSVLRAAFSITARILRVYVCMYVSSVHFVLSSESWFMEKRYSAFTVCSIDKSHVFISLAFESQVRFIILRESSFISRVAFRSPAMLASAVVNIMLPDRSNRIFLCKDFILFSVFIVSQYVQKCEVLKSDET